LPFFAPILGVRGRSSTQMTANLGRRMHRALRVAAGLSPWPPGGLVLLYHRVSTLASDPQQLAVAPERFRAHLEVLCRRGVPLSLESMAALAGKGELPPKAFAITFDDGYADVLTEAVPSLRAAGVPATIFVSTGFSDTREFWWDELERILLGAATPPRHDVYEDLCDRLRSVTGASRERTLAALAAIAGTPRDPRPSHRRLSSSEIAELAAIDGITIGSHTESHSSLAGLAADEQRREVCRAMGELARLIGKPVTSFAYPFGGPHDVPDQFAAIAEVEGVTIACTTEPGSIGRDTDRLRLPRVTVRDWPREVFESQWAAWTGTA
jgi:peptidoglycan/xylan/chitin deacetylase (PgdA/CDA1 family)